MKLILSFILFSSFFQIAFSQEEMITHKGFLAREVSQMAIYPGCENFTEKSELTKCLSNKLSEQLADKLSGFADEMSKQGINSAVARISFIISKDGKIINAEKVKGGDRLLSETALIAFNQIAETAPKIEPAKLEDGTSVNMIFQLPIAFKLAPETVTPNIIENQVLFTLVDQDLRYEIRLFQNKILKVYELKNGEYTFLGNFTNLNELGKSEPYLSLMQTDYKAQKSLLTEGKIDDKIVKIYIHNLLNAQSGNPIYIEVTDETERPIVTFQKENDFLNSAYSKLIYRD